MRLHPSVFSFLFSIGSEDKRISQIYVHSMFLIFLMGLIPITALLYISFVYGNLYLLLISILVVSLLLVPISIFLPAMYLRKKFIYRINEDFVQKKFKGFLDLESLEKKIYIEEIESVEFEKTSLGEIFNYGNVIVKGKGKEIILNGVHDPEGISAKIKKFKRESIL